MAESQAQAPAEISPRDAVAAAIASAMELFGSQEITDLALEEIEKSQTGGHWLVTLGFTVPVNAPDPYSNLLAKLALPPPVATKTPSKYERKYKVFRVDATTGKVDSIKIRTL